MKEKYVPPHSKQNIRVLKYTICEDTFYTSSFIY